MNIYSDISNLHNLQYLNLADNKITIFNAGRIIHLHDHYFFNETFNDDYK